MAATAHLSLAAPDNEKFTVQLAPAKLPRRKPNAESLLHSYCYPLERYEGRLKSWHRSPGGDPGQAERWQGRSRRLQERLQQACN